MRFYTVFAERPADALVMNDGALLVSNNEGKQSIR
jgi:hypothetical protein